MIKSKAPFIFTLSILFPAFVAAQLNHFIYLQTEGRQPFYAKLDKKIVSSSASGYLIIPKLKTGEYNITIGFPKSENAEHTYICRIDNTDLGYLIKNFGEKGWGLFNLQTLDVVMAGIKEDNKAIVITEKTDEFSSMLSQAVNDPAIKQAEKVNAPLPEKPVSAIQEEKPLSKSEIKATVKRKELITSQLGIKAVYIDDSGEKADTIEIFIPAETIGENKDVLLPTESQMIDQSKLTQENKNTAIIKDNKVEEIKEEIKKEQAHVRNETGVEDKRFLPIEIKNGTAAQKSPMPVQMVNSDCKTYASDEDFLKLRKKMAAEDNEEAMIVIAQKAFKSKCFTTEQIKNLSVLFLKDAGKYHFFDVAYQYVSDSSNFSFLENQLTDAYYISRFKAMVGQ